MRCERDLQAARYLHAQGLRKCHRRVAATGGSTNAVLHLLAMAREAGVPLTIDDFQAISSRTPVLVDLKPGGRFVAVDVDKAGGIGVVAKRLVDGGYVDGSAHDRAPAAPSPRKPPRRKETPGQEVIRAARQADQDDRRPGDSAGQPGAGRLRDQVAGHDKKQHRGPARVFDREEDAMHGGDRRARSRPAMWW